MVELSGARLYNCIQSCVWHFRSKLEELIMVTMLNTGAYVLNGTEIIADDKDVAAVLGSKLGSVPSKETAKEELLHFC